jgi:hypothetical protein
MIVVGGARARVGYTAAASNAAPTNIVLSNSSINDNAADGDVVGTGTVTDTDDTTLQGAPTVSNSKFKVVWTSGLTFSLQRSATGTLTAGVDETLTITAIDAHNNSYTSGTKTITIADHTAEVLLMTDQLDNLSASAYSGHRVVGVGFKEGDVPAGSILKAKVGGTDTPLSLRATTWDSDGSLKHAVVCLLSPSIAGSTAANLAWYKGSGSYGTASTKTLANAIALLDDPQVAFTSVTNTDDVNTETHGSGSMLAKLSDASGTATRVTLTINGQYHKRWKCWAFVKDGADGSGSADPDFRVDWWIDAFMDATDTIVAVDVVPVPSLDWWDSTTKKRLNYTAAFKSNGSTTLDTYSSLQHNYHAAFACVRLSTTVRANHARPHRLYGTLDTLVHKVAKSYWLSTGQLPTIDPTYAPGDPTYATADYTYAPFTGQSHTTGIDAGGSHFQRNVIAPSDMRAILVQSADSMAHMRVNCLAGLGFYRYREKANRTRTSESADIANTFVMSRLDNESGVGSTTTWNGDGLPDARNSPTRNGGGGGGWVDITGGTGVWSLSNSATHGLNLMYFGYFFEGHDYVLEGVLDHAFNILLQNEDGTYGNNPCVCARFWADGAFTRARYGITGTITGTEWGAIPDIFDDQERHPAFAMLILGTAFGIVPQSHEMKPYIDDLETHWDSYLTESFSHFGTAWYNQGVFGWHVDGITSPWTQAMIGFGSGMAAINRCERAWAKKIADMVCKLIAELADGERQLMLTYRGCCMDKVRLVNVSGSTQDGHLPNAFTGLKQVVTLTIAAATNVCTVPTDLVVNNGDVLYPAYRDGQSAPPAEGIDPALTEGTPYYVISKSGATCKLSASPGGSEINFATDRDQHFIWAGGNDANNITTNAAVTVYGFFWCEAATLQNFRGNADVTNARVDRMLTYMAQSTGYGDSWPSVRVA